MTNRLRTDASPGSQALYTDETDIQLILKMEDEV